MKCPHCHRIISKGAAFCPYCGTKISNFSVKKTKLTMNRNSSESPHKITKKAKEILAGLFAVVVIGGVAVHHNHYIHSPQSVNLNKALNNHVITSSVQDGKKQALNGIIINSDGVHGSDSQVGSDNEIAFDNSSLKPYNTSDTSNNDSDANPIGYTLTKNTLTLQNNGTPQSASDTTTTTSDAGNQVTFKLIHVNDNGHELIFKPYSHVNHSYDQGTPHYYPKSDQNNHKLMLHLHVGKKLAGQD